MPMRTAAQSTFVWSAAGPGRATRPTREAAKAGLNILHLISSVNPAHGGPIEGVKQLAAVNTEAGHHIEVASLDSPDQPFVREFPLKLHTFGRSYLGYRYNPRLAGWLREHRSAYDAVVVNGIWQYNSFAAWRALRNTTTPYFVYPHGMLDPWFKRRYPLKHLKKSFYWYLAQYPVLRDARAVLFTCEEERRLARQSFALYRCCEIPVHYGTAAPPGEPSKQSATFLARFPGLKGKRLLTFLGRLHEKKGCDLLLKSFAQVRSESPASERDAVHLVMAGPDQGHCCEELKRLAARLGIAGAVTWTGMVTGDLKWGLLHASEAFVLPSHQENFGIAVVEALACGVPTLISNKVNIWREIESDGVGLVGNDDEQGTGELLRKWLRASPEMREQMRARTRPCFNRRFEIRQAARSLVNVISNSLVSPA
jgi:glycosyltransferase involved in cell wall biosynthesis